MEIISLYGDILYNGFVSRKTDRYSNRKLRRIKQDLLLEIELWEMICDAIINESFNQQVLEHFHNLCLNHPQIKRDHQDAFERVTGHLLNQQTEKLITVDKSECIKVISLIKNLLLELKEQFNHRFFFNHTNILQLYYVLHNLPRYLTYGASHLDYQHVLKYTKASMNHEQKEKYHELFN